MNSKCFHVGDVLTVVTSRLVSPRHMDGLNDILQFMTGELPHRHQIPRFMRECQAEVLRQYPQFALPNFLRAQEQLLLIVKSGGNIKEMIDEWLLDILGGKFGIVGLPLIGQFRDMLEVYLLPPHVHERIDPESELLEMKAQYAGILK